MAVNRWLCEGLRRHDLQGCVGTWANLSCAQGSLRVGRVQHIWSIGAQGHWLGALQVVSTEEVLLTKGL